MTNFETSRRRFLAMAGFGALSSSSFCGTSALYAQNTIRESEWNPCVDVGSAGARNANPNEPLGFIPARNRPTDLEAPVDLALVEQNPNVAAGLMARSRDGQAQAVAGALASPAEVEKLDLPDKAPARLAAKNRWDKTELAVFFYSDGHSPELRKRVMQVASKWSQFANIVFRETGVIGNSDIRVAFQRTGHWSYVGIDCESYPGQTMNLQMRTPPSDSEYNHGVILHEFGHALGCIHEHQQPDAEGFFKERAVIDYYQSHYGWDETKTRLNVLNRYNRSQLIRASAFDRKSVMIYAYPPELTLNGQGTEEVVSLSNVDKEYIAKLYPGGPGIKGPIEDKGETETGEEPKVTAETATLPLDGDRVKGTISPSTPLLKYEFEINQAGTYTIKTVGPEDKKEGYTQVQLNLYQGDSAIDISKRAATPDLVNLVVTLPLEAGKHTLEVRHRLPDATGEFWLKLFTGKPKD